jgi:NitT/TauT family transport system ATP-binding protein
VPPAERQKRALEMIDVIGLDGFEEAYPKELSGGMRQRVAGDGQFILTPADDMAA